MYIHLSLSLYLSISIYIYIYIYIYILILIQADGGVRAVAAGGPPRVGEALLRPSFFFCCSASGRARTMNSSCTTGHSRSVNASHGEGGSAPTPKVPAKIA